MYFPNKNIYNTSEEATIGIGERNALDHKHALKIKGDRKDFLKGMWWSTSALLVFSSILGCVNKNPQTRPIEISIQEINSHREFLLAKSSCFEDALNLSNTKQNGTLIAIIKNHNYDTLHISLSNYLCDSIPIFSPDKIVNYHKKDTSISVMGADLICNGPIIKQVDIVKGDSAILILSALNFLSNSSNYMESYYPLYADSLQERIELFMVVSRSIDGNVMASYFRR